MTIHVIQKIIVEDIVSAKIVAKKLNAQISEIMKDPTNHFAEGSISVVEVVSKDRWMQELDAEPRPHPLEAKVDELREALIELHNFHNGYCIAKNPLEFKNAEIMGRVNAALQWREESTSKGKLEAEKEQRMKLAIEDSDKMKKGNRQQRRQKKDKS